MDFSYEVTYSESVGAAATDAGRWIVESLSSACEGLRTMGYGLDDHEDDDGGLSSRTETWIKQTMAATRSRLDHLLALASETPFTDETIAELSSNS